MLFIFSGPSGSGKDTIIQNITKQLSAKRVPSCVTRSARAGETGYKYFTIQQFEDLIKQNKFIEYVQVHDKNYYGTMYSDLKGATNDNNVYLKILDVDGYKKVLDAGIKCVGIFIETKTRQELYNRIIARGESAQDAKLRLSRVDYELSKKPLYDYCIINSDINSCCNQVMQIINSCLKK